MSSKTLLAILLTASLAGNAAFLITAFIKRPTGTLAAIDQLKLTQEQKNRFAEATRAFQAEKTRAHKRMAELRDVLAEELAKEAPDRQKMLGAAIDMAKVQTEMRPKLVDRLLALHSILTPAQRATLAAVMRTEGAAGGCPGAALFHAPGQDR